MFFFLFLGIAVPGRVPGSIYTDLDEAEIFTGGPLLFRFNDLDYRWVSYEDWDYSLTFNGIFFFFSLILTISCCNLSWSI